MHFFLTIIFQFTLLLFLFIYVGILASSILSNSLIFDAASSTSYPTAVSS